MTDEEKACKAICDSIPCKTMCTKCKCYIAGFKAGKDMAEADIATIAYMKGAERYKTKWHKVADGDYPPYDKCNCSINVLINSGHIAYYNYDNECWIEVFSVIEINPPIAWCEIPKFEE